MNKSIIVEQEFKLRRNIKSVTKHYQKVLEVIESLKNTSHRTYLDDLIPLLQEAKTLGLDLKPYAEDLADKAEIDLFNDLEGI